MFRYRFGRGRRSRGGTLLTLAIVVVIGIWKLVAGPAMIKAEEWNGTIVAKETGRPFFSSRHDRRQHYYLTVDCGDEKREVEVTWQMYNAARKGTRAVKVKGERWPRLP